MTPRIKRFGSQVIQGQETTHLKPRRREFGLDVMRPSNLGTDRADKRGMEELKEKKNWAGNLRWWLRTGSLFAQLAKNRCQLNGRVKWGN